MIQPSSKRVCSVILSCARNLFTARLCMESYLHHAAANLTGPVVVVDTTPGPVLPGAYVELLSRMEPRCVTIHIKPHGCDDANSVQHAAFFALRQAMNMLDDGEDHIMFMEDDIVFSSQFGQALQEARYDQEMAFYTFYQPHGGYGERGPIRSDTIQNGYFYGTQCIMFPVSSVKLLLENQASIEYNYPPGYDLRWSRYLDSQQRIAYTSGRSYVQHIGVNSRLGCMHHKSATFVE